MTGAPETTALTGLVLAAGGSSRLGQPKQLVSYRGQALVVSRARLLLQVCDRVIVVTGASEVAVRAELADLPVCLVHNPDWQIGMGSSIAAGMSALKQPCAGVLIALCDQWQLNLTGLKSLHDAWRQAPLRACAARFPETDAAWQPGPPMIAPPALFAALAALEGPQGARTVLLEHDARLLDVPGAESDLDTAADLQAMRAFDAGA